MLNCTMLILLIFAYLITTFLHNLVIILYLTEILFALLTLLLFQILANKESRANCEIFGLTEFFLTKGLSLQ